MSGLYLMINYNALERYERIIFIMIEVNYGWFFKILHRNNASLIFLILYFHLYKNIMFFSYRLGKVWYRGLIMMLLIIGAGFRGYVLVGSQIRLWAAMVITRLISVIPLNGEKLMYFVWGGYGISWVTLQLLYILHFVLPFLVIIIIILHLYFLHETGRTRGIYSHTGLEKVTFFPYFWIKDMMNIVWYLIFMVVMLLYPYSLGEVELFEEANFLNSPVHIVPEWYFCTRYAILRSVPSKGAGVLIMFARIIILFIYPSSIGYVTPPTNIAKSGWLGMFILQAYLTYLGFSPISQPFVLLSLWSMLTYFLFHFRNIFLNVLVEYCYKV